MQRTLLHKVWLQLEDIIRDWEKIKALCGCSLGVTFQFTGVEPDVTTENNTGFPLICPFNDGDDNNYPGGFVCVYRVRVTEVFVGNFSVRMKSH